LSAPEGITVKRKSVAVQIDTRLPYIWLVHGFATFTGLGRKTRRLCLAEERCALVLFALAINLVEAVVETNRACQRELSVL
jgi:hypothetical protein